MTERSPKAYIGVDLELRGSITGDSDMQIDGFIEGSVRAGGDVTLGEGATLRGPLVAHNATIRGRVFGDVEVTGALRLVGNGLVRGDVRARTAVVEEGATLHGLLDMDLGELGSAP